MGTPENSTECNHAYRIKRGPLWFCIQCKKFIKSEEIKVCEAPKLPPKIFGLTERRWQEVSPWPLLPFETTKKYGWYITILGLDEYLVMPIFRNKEPVFYSARRLTNNGGKKYNYQFGAKKQYWISKDEMRSPIVLCEGVADAAYASNVADSVALLSNFYDNSVDDLLRGKNVVVALDGDAVGFTSAIRIAKQIKVARRVNVLSLPDGKDPTDIELYKLREEIYGCK